MNPRKRILFLLLASLVAISACSTAATPPTAIVEPIFTRSPGSLPASEAEVPRISLEEAKAALDSGAAIFVDVRSAEAYEASHVAGAISISLQEQIEPNPTALDLDQDQWIITYCT
jgi:hypothetical protein